MAPIRLPTRDETAHAEGIVYVGAKDVLTSHYDIHRDAGPACGFDHAGHETLLINRPVARKSQLIAFLRQKKSGI
jgi:hypothetical protein